jgi:pimeloyl-ACP methyl ester carboxylesterase
MLPNTSWGSLSRVLNRVLALVTVLAVVPPASGVAAGKEWQWTIEAPRPPRKGKPQSPAVGHCWLPPNCKTVGGLIVGGKTLLEKRVCCDSQIRQAATEKDLGILYFEPALDAVFNYVDNDSGKRLEQALADLAKKTRHPEIELAPVLTIGHSTGGIYARNVAFWKPDRVIGIIHIKSGNFQDGLWDTSRSVASVPFLAINGEFEQYGPKGGDLGRGLRSEYSLNTSDKTKQNQTQWVMIRMQILGRRKKNPDNLMSLVVHRGEGHVSWDSAMSALCAQFIRSAADARLPDEPPRGKSPVKCSPVAAADDWLSDADIKDPKHKAAAHADYDGDKRLTFWHADQAMAEAIDKYHAGKWDQPDPTAGQPVEKRYYPPPILQDTIDDAKPR